MADLKIPEDLQYEYDRIVQRKRTRQIKAPDIERIATLTEENAALKVQVERLIEALTMIYDKWEDGVNCYEASDGEEFDESGTSLGHAVKLDFE